MDGAVTAAEDTAAILQGAAHDGVAVMIPGAFDIRRQPTGVTARPATLPAGPSIPDWERLEREREGGGAPSRRMIGHSNILTRLWHGIFR
jgi:hypothetical protein